MNFLSVAAAVILIAMFCAVVISLVLLTRSKASAGQTGVGSVETPQERTQRRIVQDPVGYFRNWMQQFQTTAPFLRATTGLAESEAELARVNREILDIEERDNNVKNVKHGSHIMLILCIFCASFLANLLLDFQVLFSILASSLFLACVFTAVVAVSYALFACAIKFSLGFPNKYVKWLTSILVIGMAAFFICYIASLSPDRAAAEFDPQIDKYKVIEIAEANENDKVGADLADVKIKELTAAKMRSESIFLMLTFAAGTSEVFSGLFLIDAFHYIMYRKKKKIATDLEKQVQSTRLRVENQKKIAAAAAMKEIYEAGGELPTFPQLPNEVIDAVETPTKEPAQATPTPSTTFDL
jgi:hypothetical protein